MGTTGTHTRTQPVRRLSGVSAVIAETYRGFRADRGFDLAGSLAFTTILTAVPLLASFSLFLAALFRENDDQILAIVNAVLPYQSVRLTQNLRDFIAESTAISTIGLLALVVTSVRLIFVVEGIFNAVWGAPKRRRWIPRVLLYTLALAALGLLLGGVGIGLRALRQSVAMDSFMSSPAFDAASSYLLKALALTLLYRFLPHARVRWAPAAVAGALVALLLEVLRLLFGLYVAALSDMNLITGSLTLLLFVVLSLYFVWVLILLGVELTHVIQTRVGPAARAREAEGHAEKAIRLLLRLSPTEPRALKELEAQPDADTAEAAMILDSLERAGLVRGNPTDGYVLGRFPHEITVAGVVEALIPDLYRVSPRRQDRVTLVLEPLFDRLDAERRALLDATLAELRTR